MSTARRQSPATINSLIQELPEGLVVPSTWLADRGYSRQSLHKYVAGNWLVREGHGAYRRPGPEPTWEQRAYSLQLSQNPPGHIGGYSALWMHGLAHYAASSEPDEIWLYTATELPAWARNEHVHTKLARFPFTLFDGLNPTRAKSRVDARFDDGVTERSWGPRKWLLRVSTPERAVLEMLDEVPSRITLDHAWDLFTGLTSLSPKRVQMLLEHCARVQVKRLFLALAERQKHTWFSRLDLKKINLRSGKRVLARGGQLDPKYLITLPESWRAVR
jgi:hypothetical protein